VARRSDPQSTGTGTSGLPEKITKAVSVAPKLTPMAALSGGMEQRQSLMAMTTAAKRFCTRRGRTWWTAGDADEQRPENIVGSNTARAGRRGHEAVRSGMSKSDIEAKVFTELAGAAGSKVMRRKTWRC